VKRKTIALIESNSAILFMAEVNNEKPMFVAGIIAVIYVLSGATQPLLMTLVKESGLGDPTCQLYMLFYYLGPACVALSFCPLNTTRKVHLPSKKVLLQSASIALIDIMAQSLNYTGSTMCGPTIFCIIYSSVTIWTAVYSRIIFQRTLMKIQWSGIWLVFGGLGITAMDSISLGGMVFNGSICVFIGSTLHAMTYVLSEAIMVLKHPTQPENKEIINDGYTEHQVLHDKNKTEQVVIVGVDTYGRVSVSMNCAIQGIVAFSVYFTWQIIYTLPHWDQKIGISVKNATIHFSDTQLLALLLSLSLSNGIHAMTFFSTLKSGGSTSTGVLKGLQAVFVFLFTSLVYCGTSMGGDEMCFSTIKCISLVLVVTGVLLYGYGTDLKKQEQEQQDCRNGYLPIVGIHDNPHCTYNTRTCIVRLRNSLFKKNKNMTL